MNAEAKVKALYKATVAERKRVQEAANAAANAATALMSIEGQLRWAFEKMQCDLEPQYDDKEHRNATALQVAVVVSEAMFADLFVEIGDCDTKMTRACKAAQNIMYEFDKINSY